MALRLLMMGTGTFALPTFRALIDSPHEVVGLVTQPDRTGRGHHSHPHPMKETAVAHGIDVFQPERVNEEASLERLRAFGADAFVVAAYGQILSAALLEIPRLGAFNLHASLLPKYRGAAPIQYAVLNGETETGVTLFRIEPRLDAGPILGVVKTPIGAEETSGQLEDRLSELAAPLTLEVLDRIERGTAEPLPQDRSKVTRARKFDKSAGLIDWSKPAREIDWHVRGMQPWPMPFAFLHSPGQPALRVLITKVSPTPIAVTQPSSPGNVIPSDGGRLLIACGDGAVEVLKIQPAGKREMDVIEFLHGRRLDTGSRFGAE